MPIEAMPIETLFTANAPHPTKGDLAAQLYPGQNYDYALPQGWVDAMYHRGWDVRPHFVYLYPKEGTPHPAPLTYEGMRMACTAAQYV